MLQVFLFALVLGGGLLAISLFSDHGDHGADVDHDVSAFKLLSLRSLIYFLFTFGGVGTALTLTWGAGAMSILPLAVVAGVGVSALTNVAFAYLQRTDSGEREGDRSFVGLSGHIIVPIGTSGVGKMQVMRGGRIYELLVRPFTEEHGEAPPDQWRSVIIVDMQGSTALISPVEELPVEVN